MLQEISCHQRGCKTAHKCTCHRSTVCYMQKHAKCWLNAKSGCSVEFTFVQATSTRTNPASTGTTAREMNSRLMKTYKDRNDGRGSH